MTASVKLSGSGEQSEDLLVAGRNIPLLPIAALLILFLLILLFLLDLACYRLRQRGFFTLDRICPPECSTKPLPLFYLFFPFFYGFSSNQVPHTSCARKCVSAGNLEVGLLHTQSYICTNIREYVPILVQI